MKDDLHSNDIHLSVEFSLPFASGRAEVTIDRTPRGAGPDARCALLGAAGTVIAIEAFAAGISIVRRSLRFIRELGARASSEERLRRIVAARHAAARARVSGEIDEALRTAGIDAPA